MAGEYKNEMQCSEFEALLSDALDEQLSGPKLAGFRVHSESCELCGPMFADARSGKSWLKSLDEITPPAHLIENILVATSGITTARLRAPSASRPQISWWDRVREQANSLLTPAWGMVRQPRFAMSFGMIFFSASACLSLAGVKLSDVRRADLRPAAIRRNYYETSGRVKKYYDNLRFVYELESRVREFKRATTPVEPAPEDNHNQKEKPKDNTSGEPQHIRPEQPQERNYSQSADQPIMAAAPDLTPVVVPVTTYRRFS